METYNKIQAIKNAILRGDSNYEGVLLPTKQRAGTYYQQASYAQMQAQRVYDNHFR